MSIWILSWWSALFTAANRESIIVELAVSGPILALFGFSFSGPHEMQLNIDRWCNENDRMKYILGSLETTIKILTTYYISNLPFDILSTESYYLCSLQIGDARMVRTLMMALGSHPTWEPPMWCLIAPGLLLGNLIWQADWPRKKSIF